MKDKIKEPDVVGLLNDRPDESLVAGQVGTVVEIPEEGVVEVELSDDPGRTHAMCALKEEELMPLHQSPVSAA